MDKSSPCSVAAKDIDIGGVAQCDNGGVSSATKFPSDEELARISSECLVMFHVQLVLMAQTHFVITRDIPHKDKVGVREDRFLLCHAA